MKKNKLMAGLFFLILIIILIVTPEGLSESIKKEIKTNDELPVGANVVYVGDMYIEGTGNHETSIVMATAEQNLRINVGLRGSDVILQAKYLLQCPGLFDYGYAKLWVRGAEEKEVDTTDVAEGYLYTVVYDCKIGDTIDWALTVIYDDLLFPYPLIDFDGGGGICSFSFIKLRIFNFFKPILILGGTILCR